MLAGGNPTIYVSDMDRAVAFYTETLGLKLQQRFGNDWASIDAGQGLVLGLHPSSPGGPRPGTGGSISVGFGVTRPLEEVVEALRRRGVTFHGGIKEDPKSPVRLAFFQDQDGNDLYLCELASY